jgi:hypothetical protein
VGRRLDAGSKHDSEFPPARTIEPFFPGDQLTLPGTRVSYLTPSISAVLAHPESDVGIGLGPEHDYIRYVRVR